ncbi:MAG TPA: AAA family ATPase [Longimicrobiaceae bacterium]|jgi:hypothetical protein
MAQRIPGPGLRGRRRECETLDRLLDGVQADRSQVLVVRGEAGIGKTALLDYLAARASRCRVARAVGVESEMELAFSGVHQLCAPMLDRMAGLPEPQRAAVGTAFGVSAGATPDLFLVGLAVLGILSDGRRRWGERPPPAARAPGPDDGARRCGARPRRPPRRAGRAGGIEARIADVGVHPDIAGFQDLAHAFDLKSAAVAARATLEAALERRESRGCHNRSDYPRLDESLRVNLVWSGPGRIEREAIPPIPDEIAALMHDVATAGKLVE